MTQTDKPSIEDMNIVIAQYDGWKEWEHKKGNWHNPERNITMFTFSNEFSYHSSWDEIHKVWDKIYAEYCKFTEHLKERRFYFDYITTMSNAMITGNITTAHRILYDAIVWVKNKNK